MKIEILLVVVIFFNIVKTDDLIINNKDLSNNQPNEQTQKIVTDNQEQIQAKAPSRNLRQKKSSKNSKRVKSSKKARKLKVSSKKQTKLSTSDRETFNQSRGLTNRGRRTPDTCDLALELFPFFYIPIIRSTQFRIAFSSNCMRKRDYTFRVFYNDTRFINYNHHPTKVKLNIFGNKYTIDYSEPKMMDEFDIMKSLVYQQAEISGTKNSPKGININNQNDVFLDPQRRNVFNPYNLRRLSSIKGAILCTTEIRRDRGWKVLKAMREKYGDDGSRKLLERHKKSVKEVLKRRKLLEKKLTDKDLLRMSQKEQARKKLWEGLERTMQDHYIKEINILCNIG